MIIYSYSATIVCGRDLRIVCEILDDALREIYRELLDSGQTVTATRGETIEITGVLIELERPRARLSRTETRGKPFTCLGELLWYLSRGNNLDFITYYLPKYQEESEDGITVRSAYGPRLFSLDGFDQVDNVIKLLTKRPASRRAVIQLFDASDISTAYVEAPCTNSMQFILRDGKLNMITNMRSNDAFVGLPHDIFCFTMLQEVIARSLDCDVGVYKHFVGSMHMYSDRRVDVELYLSEAIQRSVEMPPMPEGDPWDSITKVLELERSIRNGHSVDAGGIEVDSYWQDLIRLLQIFQATGNECQIERLADSMSTDVYGIYISARKAMRARNEHTPIQGLLDL